MSLSVVDSDGAGLGPSAPTQPPHTQQSSAGSADDDPESLQPDDGAIKIVPSDISRRRAVCRLIADNHLSKAAQCLQLQWQWE